MDDIALLQPANSIVVTGRSHCRVSSGLARLYERGDHSRTPPEFVEKVERIFARLDVSVQPAIWTSQYTDSTHCQESLQAFGLSQFQVTGGLYSDSTVPMFGMLTLSIISKRYEL